MVMTSISTTSFIFCPRVSPPQPLESRSLTNDVHQGTHQLVEAVDEPTWSRAASERDFYSNNAQLRILNMPRFLNPGSFQASSKSHPT